MLKDEVLALLKESAGEVSGQAMSERLGVSRAAVWKAMEALRGEGYTISSAPSRGYRLEDSPDRLSPGELAGALRGRTLGREIVCLDSVDSTNDECARRALAGAGEGLVVLKEYLGSPAARRLALSDLGRAVPAQRWLVREPRPENEGAVGRGLGQFGMLKWLDPELDRSWDWSSSAYLGLAFD